MYRLKWYTLQNMWFKIAGSFALAHCRSRRWLNFAVTAGWQLRKSVIQCLPSCYRRCGGWRDIANALTIFACNGCPKSSRVSPNLTIDFSSSRVSSCSFSCAALLGCAPLSWSHEVQFITPYVDAAGRIDCSRPERYACLASWMSFSQSVASPHFTVFVVEL